ncbi:hypothetical protein SSX86_026519 [Deinandra increscens subsp. villosa]|uniref:4-hydroxy-tetrahydrodipicolinate reductase n=1 Tax=Deinandra increscens subsp. villosa TaxID=3103831 RepID=A0AAP0CF06_9ASTR
MSFVLEVSVNLFGCQHSEHNLVSYSRKQRCLFSMSAKLNTPSIQSLDEKHWAHSKGVVLPIMVNSCMGKMGQAVVEAGVSAGLHIVPASFGIQKDAGKTIQVGGKDIQVHGPSDREATLASILEEYPNLIVVDFTVPNAVNDNAKLYCNAGVPFVMGTTGGDRDLLYKTVEDRRLYAVISPQMGKQVVAFLAAMEIMAKQFPGAFSGYTLEVTESHQATKLDTSGTAKAVISCFQKLGVSFDLDQIQLIRDPKQQIETLGVPEEHLNGHAFHTYRLKSPDGTVSFEFQHNVCGRSIYAEGAIDAALFLSKKIQSKADKKIYDMIDVLREETRLGEHIEKERNLWLQFEGCRAVVGRNRARAPMIMQPQTIIKQYHLVDLLMVVFHGKLSNGEQVLIKKLDTSSLQDSESDFKDKLAMVSGLKDEYFSQLCGYCLEKKNRILLYQYATKGCLYDIIHGRKNGGAPSLVLNWAQRVKIAYGAARGLEYLHEKVKTPVVHCEVRSSNVLVFDEFESKIGDFSLSNLSSDNTARLQSTRVLGTFGYYAPEYAMTGQITQKSDVYSFGVVLLELLTGRKPVDHTVPKGQQSLVTWATPRLSEDKVKQCVDPKLNNDYPPKAVAKMAAVAALCVQYEAEFRPNMTIVVKALQPLLNSKQAASAS